MTAFGPQAGGLRLIRIVVVCVAFGTVVNSGGAVYLFVQNAARVRDAQAALERIAAEGQERRDQTCRSLERQEEAAIVRVRRAYAYLDDLPVAERGASLTRAVITGLAGQYTEAQESVAPAFCNDPGVGLREPGPKLPKQRFRYLKWL